MCALLIAGVAADQVSKTAAVRFLRHKASVVLVPGFLDLAYTENTGGVFGIGDEERPRSRRMNNWLIGIHAAGILMIAFFLPRIRGGSLNRAAAVSMILSGAAGNLTDRIRYGHVIDFIHLHAGGILNWPFLFNVADALICAGAAILAIGMIFRNDGKKTVTN
jgi:signal peptidase II